MLQECHRPPLIKRRDFGDELFPGGGKHDPIRAAVLRGVAPADQSALLQTVNETGYVGPVGEQFPAEHRLREPFRGEAKEIQDIELARAEVPLFEENPTGVPDDVGGAEEFNDGLAACLLGTRWTAHAGIVYISIVYMSTIYFSGDPGKVAEGAKAVEVGLAGEICAAAGGSGRRFVLSSLGRWAVKPAGNLAILPEYPYLSIEMEKVVIIGSGCAGLTAALYAARANLTPLVLTGTQPGGLLTTTSTVENYPGFPEGINGFELMQRMQQQAERFGARVKFATVDSAELSTRPFKLVVDGEKVEAETLIIASGAGHRHLGLDSEHLLENKGVTYCATCDGALPIFRNQPLVVVGGGDSACEEALYLTRFGSIVYLVHRRDTLRASRIMAERAVNHAKIKMVWDTIVTEVLDVKQDKVTGVRARNVKTNAEAQIDCAGVFVAIGHVPNTSIFTGQLDMDDNGYLLPVKGAATRIPGVFVAGDCADQVYRQAITAAGMGCAAAIEAERFLAAL